MPTWPWDLDSGNTDSKAEGDMWRTGLGDRAGSKQSSATKCGTKMGLHGPHLPQAKSLLLGCHHPAWSILLPTPLLPILRFYYQADSGPWLPPSQLPKQFKPPFPISAVGIHCCLKD